MEPYETMFTGTQADIQQSYFHSMGGTLQNNSFQEFMMESVCTPDVYAFAK